ncbi:MAG: tRNA (N(6)-L-threonylcarbamoyladenosine(37)-C(2))-methylthiotransferase MtaB [Rhodospirillales bacterium]|nr:tRNA (N(6)-L-threonylcarbamoyladenosine(37)-C(2))-methylthiotransferase MtaB [Rhodospirillales bacterium]
MTQARIVNFGCRLNAAEAATIEALLAAAGDGDTLVVNTCAVTQEAEREALAAIRRLKRERPEARIVVTGCSAQLDPARYEALAEVDAVVGNRDKLDPAVWRARTGAVSDIMVRQDFVAAEIGLAEGRTRAFVEVQQGCDHRCTFCVIPFARGPSRSLPAEGAVARVRQAVAAGRREVVLTGVDLTAWGDDLPDQPRLSDLCAAILAAVPDLARLRLSSVDPAEIDGRLFGLLADEPRLAPFLHLSIQAGDDLILKRMKRRHSRAQVIDVVARARDVRPDIAIAADLIAGFPTESDAAFENTRALVGELGLAHAHVFAYSARPGAPAARMRALPESTVRRRARELRDTAAGARLGYLAARVGGMADVLVEKSGQDGLDAQGVRVRLTELRPRGALVRVRVASHDANGLTGVPA